MRRAFSLVELMIVVAIIGILSAIAVPYLREASLKAKKREAWVNLRGIGDADVAYYAANGEWISGAGSNPGGSLTKNARPWLEGQPGWSTLGWRPDGQVRCSYVLDVYTGGTMPRADAFCDLDDDNNASQDIVRYYIPTETRTGYFVDVNPDQY